MDVNKETGEPVGIPNQLQYAPTGENVLPVWSPDGKSFAFLKGNFRSFDASRSIIIADGSNIKEFHIPPGYGAGALRWKTDGSKIGMMVAGKETKWSLLNLIVESGQWETIPVSVVKGVPHFDWSGNNKTIFLTRSGKGVVELDLETGAERYLYQDTSAAIFRWLDCSWDKKRLAFLVLNKELLLDIMVINLETEDIHKVGTKLGYFSWSGDGRKIVSNKAFNTKANKQALFISPESGGPAMEFDLSQNLPPRSEIQFPDWSPDGKKIIFNLKSTQSEVSLFRNINPAGK
jgi:Tol biopolymer transport system component